MALSCWRRKYSRWPLSSSDWTCDWIFEPIATTSSSRARISDSRRSRLPTSTSSSSACFSSVLSRSAPAIRCASTLGIVDVGDHDLELLGQVGHLLDDVGERLLHVAHQRGQLRGLVDDVGRLGHLRHQVGLGLQPVLDPHPLPALDQDPQRPVGHADHAGDDAEHADRVQILGPGRLCLRVGAGDHRDRAVAAQDVVDQLDAALLPDVERDQHVGEGHGVAQRQHAHALGERRGAGDRDVTGTAAGGPDLDHCFSAGSIGTACLGAGWRRTSGSSTRSMPSS